MFYHVRKVDQKLNESKYNTIEFPEEGVKFSDMYHFYTCKLLGVGHVACRCVPCYCPVCNERIQKEWIHGIYDEDQPRFQKVKDCVFSKVLGDEKSGT